MWHHFFWCVNYFFCSIRSISTKSHLFFTLFVWGYCRWTEKGVLSCESKNKMPGKKLGNFKGHKLETQFGNVSVSNVKTSEIIKFSDFFSLTFQDQKFLSFLVEIYSIFSVPNMLSYVLCVNNVKKKKKETRKKENFNDVSYFWECSNWIRTRWQNDEWLSWRQGASLLLEPPSLCLKARESAQCFPQTPKQQRGRKLKVNHEV